MKKVKLLLLAMICFGIVNAQSDSSVNKTPLKADTIIISSDSVNIVNTTFSADTITIGNIMIVKGSGNNTKTYYKNQTPIIAANADTLQLGRYKIVID